MRRNGRYVIPGIYRKRGGRAPKGSRRITLSWNFAGCLACPYHSRAINFIPVLKDILSMPPITTFATYLSREERRRRKNRFVAHLDRSILFVSFWNFCIRNVRTSRRVGLGKWIWRNFLEALYLTWKIGSSSFIKRFIIIPREIFPLTFLKRFQSRAKWLYYTISLGTPYVHVSSSLWKIVSPRNRMVIVVDETRTRNDDDPVRGEELFHSSATAS